MVAIALAAVVCYSWVLRLAWMFDDPFHLRTVRAHRLLDYFSSASFWHGLPFRMFTPLLFSSLEVDYHLFGLNPAGFYTHQLIALILAMIAIYMVATLYFEWYWSLLLTFLVLLSTPAISLSHLLMGRHYLEGLIFASIAAALFVVGLRRDSPTLNAASAGAYFLALLCKEIFVPLFLLLILLPERSLRDRATAVRIHIVALVAWLAWRMTMLGTMVGGYGWAPDYPQLLLRLPLKFADTLFGLPSVSGALLLGGVTAIIVVSKPSKDMMVRCALAIAATALPVLPVSTELQPRYALGTWIILALLVTWSLRRLAQRSDRFMIMTVALLAIFTVFGSQQMKSERRACRQMSAEARFVLTDSGAGAVLGLPLTPPSTLSELTALRIDLGRPAGATWFYDELFLCTRPGLSVYEYDAHLGSVVMTRSAYSRALAYCSGLRTAPLQAAFRYDAPHGTLRWNLGPYSDGTYAFVLGDGTQVFVMPRVGGYQLNGVDALMLRLRYRSPQGWVTYSPELRIPFSGKETRWSRAS